MIKLLRIRNIAVIASIEVEMEAGLTLLTGETGAGKSIVIDALGLVLGTKGSADLIRTGETTAWVEAIVEGCDAVTFLDGHGLPRGDDLIVRRELSTGGKGRASINGALVPVSLLRDLAPLIATVHGQHDSYSLINTAKHIELLDRYAGTVDAVKDLGVVHHRLRDIECKLEALRGDRRELERRREMLAYQLGEIESAALRVGEEEDLRREKNLLIHAEKVAALSNEAYSLLYDDESAVLSRLNQVYRMLSELSAIESSFSPHLDAGSTIRAQIEDLALLLRDYREGVQASPARLDEIESRLALIERLKRKYGSNVGEVLAFAESCRTSLAALGSPEEHERELEASREEARRCYWEGALTISRKRQDTAGKLEVAVRRELSQLAMEKCRFKVAFKSQGEADQQHSTQGWTARGIDGVEFLIAPNPGEELRPLARIASGGELSRILLGLLCVANIEEPQKTVIFDEVDAGIGGRVAAVVGQKLKAVARHHQVVCVTHLPQIAALADQHFSVSKMEENKRTVVSVRRLSDAERVDEVARMVGGAQVSDTARQHARELLMANVK
jgi:DNA repair protein RecN (Recombination protein N)